MSDDTWHVYPGNDLIEHDTETDDCPCGPTVEPVERGDGSIRWVLIHHSLDGRELNEVNNGNSETGPE